MEKIVNRFDNTKRYFKWFSSMDIVETGERFDKNFASNIGNPMFGYVFTDNDNILKTRVINRNILREVTIPNDANVVNHDVDQSGYVSFRTDRIIIGDIVPQFGEEVIDMICESMIGTGYYVGIYYGLERYLVDALSDDLEKGWKLVEKFTNRIKHKKFVEIVYPNIVNSVFTFMPNDSVEYNKTIHFIYEKTKTYLSNEQFLDIAVGNDSPRIFDFIVDIANIKDYDLITSNYLKACSEDFTLLAEHILRAYPLTLEEYNNHSSEVWNDLSNVLYSMEPADMISHIATLILKGNELNSWDIVRLISAAEDTRVTNFLVGICGPSYLSCDILSTIVSIHEGQMDQDALEWPILRDTINLFLRRSVAINIKSPYVKNLLKTICESEFEHSADVLSYLIRSGYFLYLLSENGGNNEYVSSIVKNDRLDMFVLLEESIDVRRIKTTGNIGNYLKIYESEEKWPMESESCDSAIIKEFKILYGEDFDSNNIDPLILGRIAENGLYDLFISLESAGIDIEANKDAIFLSSVKSGSIKMVQHMLNNYDITRSCIKEGFLMRKKSINDEISNYCYHMFWQHKKIASNTDKK